MVYSAELDIGRSSSSVNVGDLVTITLRVDSSGVSINNAEGVLNFPTDVLEAISVNKNDSIFSLWVEEPKYSNAQGQVVFNGGLPTPGFSGSSGNVLKVTFNAKKAGQANLFLSNVAIRANDGNGTDVFSGNLKSAPVLVIEKEIDTRPTSSDRGVSPVLKLTELDIYSETHPDQTFWYSNRRPELRWNLPEDASVVQLAVDQDIDATPRVSYKPVIKSKYLDNLDDGVWYFKARYKNDLGWSKTSSFTLNIDATKPKIDFYDFAYDYTKGAVVFSVSATDALSGVAQYYFGVDDTKENFINVSNGQLFENQIKVTTPGVHKIHISAVDFAGNKETVSGTFSIPVSTSDQVLFRIYSFDVTLKVAFVGLLVFSIIALLLAFIAWYRLISRKHFRGVPLSLIKREIHNGFLIFKDKLESNLTILEKAKSKRRLTIEEEEVYKNINKNLKYLEEYVDKSVDHLK